MIITSFDTSGELIVVTAWLWGRQGDPLEVEVALDTAASETIIIPEITDALGYSARDGDARTMIRSAVASEPGYLLRVSRFGALGFELSDFRLHVHDLPEGYGIGGLIGLNFLRPFDYKVRSLRGELHVARASNDA